MAASAKVGSFTLNTVTGNQAITGVGFQPKAMIFWTAREFGGDQEYEECLGVATSSTARWVWTSNYCDYCDQASSDYDLTKCIQLFTAGALSTAADFVSNDADGFTINVTTANATARTIYYKAIGGADVSAFAGDFALGTTTGNLAETGVGFQPKAVLFVHGPKNTTGATITNIHQLGIGVGLSSTSRWSNYYIGTNATTSDEQSIQITTRCIISISTAAAIDEAVDYVSNDADGFTVNRITKSATDFTVGYLALGGTAQYAAGTFAQPGVTGNQGVTGTGFTPVGEFFSAEMKASGGTGTAHSDKMIGAATSTTARAVTSIHAQNGTDSSQEPDTLASTTLCLQNIAGAGTNLAGADFISHDADGFTVNWTTVDATARQMAYLAIGSAAAGGAAVLNSWKNLLGVGL